MWSSPSPAAAELPFSVARHGPRSSGCQKDRAGPRWKWCLGAFLGWKKQEQVLESVWVLKRFCFFWGCPHIFCSANNLPRTCLKQEPLPSVKGGCFASSPKTCYITQRQFKKAKHSVECRGQCSLSFSTLAIFLDDWAREDHWPWNTMTMPLASIRVRDFLLHFVGGKIQVLNWKSNMTYLDFSAPCASHLRCLPGNKTFAMWAKC